MIPSPESVFVMQVATQLIAAGGPYATMKLEDVIEDIVGNLAALDDYFYGPEDDEGGGGGDDCPCPECVAERSTHD